VGAAGVGGANAARHADLAAVGIEADRAAQRRRHELQAPAGTERRHARVPDRPRERELLVHRRLLGLVDVERRAGNPGAVEIAELHALRQAFAVADIDRKGFDRPAGRQMPGRRLDEQRIVRATALGGELLKESGGGAVNDEKTRHDQLMVEPQDAKSKARNRTDAHAQTRGDQQDTDQGL
jgi:hypothetical protein